MAAQVGGKDQHLMRWERMGRGLKLLLPLPLLPLPHPLCSPSRAVRCVLPVSLFAFFPREMRWCITTRSRKPHYRDHRKRAPFSPRRLVGRRGHHGGVVRYSRHS